jgi:hypothetical protein
MSELNVKTIDDSLVLRFGVGLVEECSGFLEVES